MHESRQRVHQRSRKGDALRHDLRHNKRQIYPPRIDDVPAHSVDLGISHLLIFVFEFFILYL